MMKGITLGEDACHFTHIFYFSVIRRHRPSPPPHYKRRHNRPVWTWSALRNPSHN